MSEDVSILNIELPRLQRARVWLGEYPSQSLASGRVFTDRLEAGSEVALTTRKVAIEWCVPLGPYSIYALLVEAR